MTRNELALIRICHFKVRRWRIEESSLTIPTIEYREKDHQPILNFALIIPCVTYYNHPSGASIRKKTDVPQT